MVPPSTCSPPGLCSHSPPSIYLVLDFRGINFSWMASDEVTPMYQLKFHVVKFHAIIITRAMLDTIISQKRGKCYKYCKKVLSTLQYTLNKYPLLA